MEIAFDAIGIEIANEAAFNTLAEDVGKRGEVSRLTRKSGVLHGRCLKLGEGLEVWSMLYESESGEVTYADCRPAFRAKYAQKISPWVLTEFDKEGEAVIHGFIEDTEAEVLFELQNLTEVGTRIFQNNLLDVGLCGLAYRAEIVEKGAKTFWRAFDEVALNVAVAGDNDWSLCGKVLAFEPLHNAFSGNDLYWLYLDLGELKLEVLVNQRVLQEKKLRIGSFVRADIWLQGHILSQDLSRGFYLYEGVDWTTRPADFWKKLKRPN